MCFSATASFVAAGTLSAVGISSISKATKKELPVACIPLLFGAQQLIDGIVWITPETALIHHVSVYAYAFFAFIFWPMFTPFALLRIETNEVRRRVLTALLIVGAGVSGFFIHSILTEGVVSQVLRHCVTYSTPHPYELYALAFYLIAVCGSFFVSSKGILRIFGAILLISFCIAGWFYIEAFSSTWCFFAALLSVLLLFYFHTKKFPMKWYKRFSL
ncbi:hypothetical protein BH11PAT2_BH11PAT2_01330 [soil metagenome]